MSGVCTLLSHPVSSTQLLHPALGQLLPGLCHHALPCRDELYGLKPWWEMDLSFYSLFALGNRLHCQVHQGRFLCNWNLLSSQAFWVHGIFICNRETIITPSPQTRWGSQAVINIRLQLVILFSAFEETTYLCLWRTSALTMANGW